MKLFKCSVSYQPRDDVPLGMHNLLSRMTNKTSFFFVICRNEDRQRHAAQKTIDAFMSHVHRVTRGTQKVPLKTLYIEVEPLKETDECVYDPNEVDHQKTEIFSVDDPSAVVIKEV